MKHKFPSWLPIIIFDGVWILVAFLLKANKLLDNDIIRIAVLLFIITVCYSIYICVSNNTSSKQKVFYDLAKIPFWVIFSHILVLFSKTTFNQEGGWLLLYALVIAGTPISALLLVTGLFISKSNRQKQI